MGDPSAVPCSLNHLALDVSEVDVDVSPDRELAGRDLEQGHASMMADG